MDEASLHRRLEPRGFYVTAARGLPDPAEPWSFAERLTGESVHMVERQIIRAVPGGRSFASSHGPAPLHNDLQLFLGRPADLQVLTCVRPAARGGATLLFDTWSLLDRLRGRDLFDALFDVERPFPFVSGRLVCPTVARFDGRTSFVCSPQTTPSDGLAARVREELERSARAEIELAAGDVLVADNHRALHGRTAFDDPSRELVRVLIWLREARPVPGWISGRARDVRIAGPSSSGPLPAESLGVVRAMMAGRSPGALAREHGIAEPALYAWRDALHERALAELRGYFAS